MSELFAQATQGAKAASSRRIQGPLQRAEAGRLGGFSRFPIAADNSSREGVVQGWIVVRRARDKWPPPKDEWVTRG